MDANKGVTVDPRAVFRTSLLVGVVSSIVAAKLYRFSSVLVQCVENGPASSQLCHLFDFDYRRRLRHRGTQAGAAVVFSLAPRDSSIRSAATESPLASAIAFCSLRAFSR
jgi:hypothetical protein